MSYAWLHTEELLSQGGCCLGKICHYNHISYIRLNWSLKTLTRMRINIDCMKENRNSQTWKQRFLNCYLNIQYKDILKLFMLKGKTILSKAYKYLLNLSGAKNCVFVMLNSHWNYQKLFIKYTEKQFYKFLPPNL